MRIVGGIIGFLFGGVICLVVATVVGVALVLFGPLASLLAPAVTPLGVALGAISPNASLLLGFIAVFVVTGLHYALGAVSLLGPMAATPSGRLPSPPPELYARGFIIGLTASINFAIWTVISHSPAIGSVFALIGLLAVIPGVSKAFGYQVVLGWTSWLLPMSYLVTPFGILLFIINLVVTLLATGAFPGVRFDPTTATFETAGGTLVVALFGISPLPGATGFNLGNFTFINFPTAAPTPFIPGPGGGLSTHETGHTLTIGAFGGFFGWINAYDESIPPLGRRSAAYGEEIPESHFPRAGRWNVGEWS